MELDYSRPLLDLLHLCTVRIEGNGGNGSGFFVNPCIILTCAHVVEDAQERGSPIFVIYLGNEYPAKIIEYEFGARKFPDLALLKADIPDHPCVYLSSEVQRNDPLYGFGYHDEFHGGEGIEGQYEALSWFDEARTQELIKFSDTLVVPGYSGGPLLNLRTGAVCGVIKRTLGDNAPMGGRAVPVQYAIDLFRLGPLQEAYHAKDTRWPDAVKQIRDIKAKAELSQAPGQDVLIYDKPNNRYARDRLFGREEVIETVNAWLSAGKRVLLYGEPASGKTALAATVAERRLLAGMGRYIWLSLKNVREEEVLDALTRRFTTEKDRERFKNLSIDRQVQELCTLLEQSGINLWVMDDAGQGSPLKMALEIAPKTMSVIITSRTKYLGQGQYQGQDIDVAQEIGDIAQPAALDMLLEVSGRRELRQDPATMRLLRVLEFHPYSIKIAGRLLSEKESSPRDLLEMIEDRPEDMEMPGGLAEHGRESMGKILDAVVASLKTPTNDPEKDAANRAVLNVFQAFGAFFASGATIDLLSCYLGQKSGEVYRTLRRLEGDTSLARQLPGTRYFDIHDKVFSYARALWIKETGSAYAKTFTAINAFLENHADDDALLASEIDNLKGAASQALQEDPDTFLNIISTLAIGGYMESWGYSLDLLRLLDQAIPIAREKEQWEILHHLLSKRGNAHNNRLEFTKAVQCYEEALILAPDWRREVILQAVLGYEDTRLGKHAEAAEHFRQSHSIVEEHNLPDEQADYISKKMFILSQESFAAYQRKDYQKAKLIAVQGLDLALQAEDFETATLFRSNFGTTELLLGAQAALTIHQKALTEAEKYDDRQLLAVVYYGLAVDYMVLDEYAQSRECFVKARQLYEEYGDLEKLKELKSLEKCLSGG